MSVVVVGGGVLGFMHALEASRLGHPVTHLEREPGSRGASVRNFGLIWVSGRAGGPELDLARRARVRWAEIAAEVPGTGFRPNGSLTLARDDAELALLKEAAARPDAGLRDYELLDPAAVRAVNPALRGEFAGGLLVPGGRGGGAAAGPRGAARRPAGRHVGPGARTSGCRAGRPSNWPRTRCGTTPAPGTAPTWSCSAPGRRTPGSRGRIWPRSRSRRSAGSGCR